MDRADYQLIKKQRSCEILAGALLWTVDKPFGVLSEGPLTFVRIDRLTCGRHMYRFNRRAQHLVYQINGIIRQRTLCR